MVGLDRTGVVAPKRWKAKVEKALPDATAFWAAAALFELLALEARRGGFEAVLGYEFPAVWRADKAVKNALKAMTKGHCAYCQGSVEDVGYGAVEHYKPKSLFPLLAYEIGNYLFSCERCNTTKSNKWPQGGGEYVRPDEGDPAERFVFTQRGRVRGRARDAAARRTVEDFGLNRPNLCERRATAIRTSLRVVRLAMEMPGLTEEQRVAIAQTQVVPKLGRFSEAINQNVRREWRRALPAQQI